MRWRIAVLIALSALLGAAAMLAIWKAGAMSVQAQNIFNESQNVSPTVAQQNLATTFWTQSGLLQQVATPLVTGALLCITAVLAILSWSWQVRANRAGR